jgi:hypothetical protein
MSLGYVFIFLFDGDSGRTLITEQPEPFRILFNTVVPSKVGRVAQSV